MRGMLLVLLIGSLALADSSKSDVFRQKNSKCRVEKSGGEYPTFKVFQGKHLLYAPASDGIVNALFSPDGRYVALGAGEIDGFGVMIVNCGTGNRKGFWPGKATFLKKWEKQKLIVDGGEVDLANQSLP